MSVEIDLHGHSVAEALARFTHAYNAAVAAGGAAEIRVVHGHGASGGTSKIRVRLRELLAEHADRLDFRHGEACVDPNPGLTIVYPRQPLPDPIERLGDAIVAYCEPPKTGDKIVQCFREHGEPRILEALKAERRRGRLAVRLKGAHRVYAAVPGASVSTRA